ncbi:MAG: poly-beta-hydroxybutyrate polymerase N-terminal domain-containing protein, partial [Rhodomicrobium sp.]
MNGSASAIDRFFHYLLARQTGGVSPAGLWLSYLDWAVHLSLAPGTQAKLAWRAMSDAIAFQQYLASVLQSADG